jgi:general secretion pathway protein L
MAYRLYIRPLPPSEDPEQHYSWVLQDAGGDISVKGNADTREVIEQTLVRNAMEEVELIGLIPADETVFCVADIPARQSHLVAQALPYAIEEQVAQNIDTLHLALGRHTEDGYQVAAIDTGQMAYWWHLLKGWQNTQMTAIYPDAALLPMTENGWTLCLADQSLLMRSDRGEWLAIQAGNLPVAARIIATPSTDSVMAEIPVRLYSSGTDRENQESIIREFSEVSERLQVTQEALGMSVTELLAWSHHQQLCQPINLCQAQFSMNPRNNGAFSAWKPLIAVAAIWFVIQVTLEIGMGIYHHHQAEQLQNRAMAIYRDVFPEDENTHAGNVQRVIQGQLRVAEFGTSQADFMTLLRFTADQYNQLPDRDSVTFNSINYSRNRGELVVDIRADSYDRMSRLRDGLTDAGVQAQIGSVVNEPGGARGRLTVSGD